MPYLCGHDPQSALYRDTMKRLLFWIEVIVVAALTFWGFAQMLLSLGRALWNAL